MRNTSSTGYLRRSDFPLGVKWLLISNIALFLVYFFAVRVGWGDFFRPLGLIPRDVLFSFAIWQPVTYLFLHDPFGVFHILFNMLALWWFGADLERVWGRQAFLRYYFVCGIGAGLCVVLANLFFGNLNTRTIGASGAIYGLLLAYGVLFPDREILFYFLFPIKVKYFVMIIGAVAFLGSIGSSGSGVSHVAHLGGLVVGYVYLKGFSQRRRRWAVIEPVRQRYQHWRMERAKRKFQVYLRKQDRDRFVQ